MSAQKFKEEEIRFLKDQHQKASMALQDTEETIKSLETELRELLDSKSTVCHSGKHHEY